MLLYSFRHGAPPSWVFSSPLLMGTSQSRMWTICVPVSIHFVAFLYLWSKQRSQRNLEALAFEKIGYVSGIFIYPVKSCKGVSLDSSNCFLEGLEFDRRWVVVDKDYKYVQSYDKPVFAQVTPHFEDENNTLCLDAPGMDTLRVSMKLDRDENCIEDLKVLRISSRSQYVGDEASAWFSTLLDSPGYRMYQIYEPRYSMQDTKWGDVALPGDKTRYAALSAYHITTEASLKALNKQLSSPVGMDRFRSNIVINGTEPFAEDHWNHKILKIANVKFRKLKDCGRCVQTTVDPKRGEKGEKGEKDGLEPLSTLRRTRLFEDRDPRHGYAPYFGIQSAPDCEGTIKIGDPVFISC